MRMFSLSPLDVTTDTIWGDIAEHFERFASKTGEISAETVRRGAANSELQIWGLQDAERVLGVVVTELSETPRGILCTFRVACGTAPVAIQERLIGEVCKWAKQMGATRARIIGRRGWWRRLRHFLRGLRVVAFVMEWDL